MQLFSMVWPGTNQILPNDQSEFLDSDELKRILKFKSTAGVMKNLRLARH